MIVHVESPKELPKKQINPGTGDYSQVSGYSNKVNIQKSILYTQVAGSIPGPGAFKSIAYLHTSINNWNLKLKTQYHLH